FLVICFFIVAYYYFAFLSFFFFFQAEDGIRDSSVTGVQTCALPILSGPPTQPVVVFRPVIQGNAALVGPVTQDEGDPANSGVGRSEERRVGKECRVGVSRDE